MAGEAPLYPHCLRTFRPVERMVMNDKASLALGDSNMIRHNEVEILEVIDQRRESFTTVVYSRYSLIHIYLLVLSKPEFDCTLSITLSDRGGLVTLRATDISMV